MTKKSNPFPSSEFALLGFLYAGPSHGYELHKRITEADGVGMIWGLKLSNMYAQLDKLEQAGLISGKIQSNEQRPARVEFSLTDTGIALFEQWLVKLVNHPRDFRQEFMVRTYFLAQYMPQRTEEVFQNQLAECERWENTTKDRKNALSEPGSFESVVYQFRVSQIQSMVGWLKWLLTQQSKIKFQ